MADSIRLQVPKKTFVKVNGTEKFGSIYHISGGDVAYVQASSTPASFNETTATIMTSRMGQLLPPYNGLGTSNLYAYALNESAVLGVAPGE